MIARVFPRRIKNATPDDEYAFVGEPPFEPPKDIAEVHVSVTFSWDLHEGYRLKKAWEIAGFKVKIGGPAMGDRGGDFVPGMYLRPGYVITSRGCPNNCWYCSVPKREGDIRELPITEGSNVLDDNFLACSKEHQQKVFVMLSRQKGPIQFTGGLEAKRLEPWHAEQIRELRAKQVFFAFDSDGKWDYLKNAVEVMFSAGFKPSSKAVRAYVLCGFPGDIIFKAKERMERCLSIGCVPMAMPYRDISGKVNPVWARFARKYQRPAMMKFPGGNK